MSRVRMYDRNGCFPASGPGELSVCSWNLLAQCYNRYESGSLDWQTERLPALRQWLSRLSTFDVLCFQEVDRQHAERELLDLLQGPGFSAVMQARKDFPVVNATFFKHTHFRLAWEVHRSRALLLGLELPDGRTIGVVNVHLQAGAEKGDEAYRVSQLSSALRRMHAHN